MPDKKPTDAEIVKALNQCACSETNCYGCPYWDTSNCSDRLCMDTLDLLNRLQADVDNYKQIAENQQKIILDKAFENKRLRKKCENTQIGYNFVQDDIKTLKKEKYKLQKALNQSEDYRVIAKAEAYKEFAEGLKEKATQKFDWNEYVEVEEIDNLLKELVGEDND